MRVSIKRMTLKFTWGFSLAIAYFVGRMFSFLFNWMTERISREDDSRCYQPKIHSERIGQLYILKEVTGVPMTVLLDRAIEAYVCNHISVYRLETSAPEASYKTAGSRSLLFQMFTPKPQLKPSCP